MMCSDITQTKLQQTINDARNEKQREYIVWGIALIAVGSLFFLERLGLLDLRPYIGDKIRWWYCWPLLVALVGVVKMLSASTFEQVMKGTTQVIIGLWLYVCLTELWGWTFRTSWPIILIAFGASTLISGIYNLTNKSTTNSDKESQS
ncbi:LiaI-LiaF-like domain-containing protein [Undibacterium sp. RuTC16W]|uniref:LiaI-LiaF-like domain-containing protein n=1 Tax=Undibacterium sp. RuTC16W TaxID=3413048 RepID=UPI003BF2A457